MNVTNLVGDVEGPFFVLRPAHEKRGKREREKERKREREKEEKEKERKRERRGKMMPMISRMNT